MTDIRKEAYAYFRKTPGFDRCFRQLRKKWRAYGKASGMVKLTDATEEERRALEGFFGRSFVGSFAGASDVHSKEGSAGKTLSFSVRSFEDALRETRFCELNLQQLLELYFGEPMQTNAQQKADKEEQLRIFFERCQRSFSQETTGQTTVCKAASDWIRAVRQEKAYGYQIILQAWKRKPEEAEKLVRAVGMALNEAMPDTGETDCENLMLAVLAAKVSGNPHCFDRGTKAGQLLTCALCRVAGTDFPSGAEELAALYLRYGIQPDEISSMVAVFGLSLECEGGIHPGAAGFREAREPFLLMQKNLEHVTRAYGTGSCVFVVENEMVFSHLCEKCLQLYDDSVPTLICTMGQPRKAAWQLLDLLASEELEIFYAGDLDPEGMDIADRIWRRYPSQVTLWRMGPAEYELSRSEEDISERRLAILSRLRHPQLIKIAALLRAQKRPDIRKCFWMK